MEKIEDNLVLNKAIDQFWDSVPQVWNRIRSHLRQIAADQFDISVEQFHVLRHIRRGLTCVKDIADERHISRPAASQAVDLLVEKGLVTRKDEADDRRFVHLALTPEGEDLLDRMFRQNRAWMAENLAALSPKDLSDITVGLALLNKAFEAPVENLAPISHLS